MKGRRSRGTKSGKREERGEKIGRERKEDGDRWAKGIGEEGYEGVKESRKEANDRKRKRKGTVKTERRTNGGRKAKNDTAR